METPIEILGREMFWMSFLAFGIVSLIIGGLVSLFAMSSSKNTGCAVALIALVITVLGSPIRATYDSAQATGADWEKAKWEKSTYVEKLFGVWVGYSEEVHTCEYKDVDLDDDGASTGCKYVTEDSYCASKDSDGDCTDTDYRYYPWFTYERSQWGELNVFKRGHYLLAGHLAPEDWEHNRFKVLGVAVIIPPDKTFEYKSNPDWLRIKEAVDTGAVLPGAVYNNYPNWTSSDDVTLLREYGGDIPQYQELGLLPALNKIHDGQGKVVEVDTYLNPTGSGFDFEAVQYLGGLQVNPEFNQRMQTTAAYWSAMAGPEIQASAIFGFAPASKVPERSQWIHTARAYLSQEEVWGKYLLPKNLLLVLCGVDDEGTTVQWCEMETGMWKGNERLLTEVKSLAPFAFTPESIFGTYTAQFKQDLLGFSRVDYDWDDRENVKLLEAEIVFKGGVLDEQLRHPTWGFKRVEMKEYESKSLTLQPDPEQIQAIKAKRTVESGGSAFVLWFILIGAAAKGSKKS